MAVLDLGRHRLCTAFVGGVPTLPVRLGELQARSLGARGRGLGRGRPVADRRGRRAGDHQADAVDADLLLGRRPTASAIATRTSRCTRASGATATGSRSPRRGSAIIYGRSDSTINRGGVRMGTSEIYRAVLVARRGRRRAGRRPARGTAPTAGWSCSSCCATASRADRRAARPRSAPAAPGLLAAPRPRRDPPDRGGAADAVGQAARGAGQADPDGDRPGAGGRRGSRSPTPRRSTTFVEMAAAARVRRGVAAGTWDAASQSLATGGRAPLVEILGQRVALVLRTPSQNAAPFSQELVALASKANREIAHLKSLSRAIRSIAGAVAGAVVALVDRRRQHGDDNDDDRRPSTVGRHRHGAGAAQRPASSRPRGMTINQIYRTASPGVVDILVTCAESSRERSASSAAAARPRRARAPASSTTSNGDILTDEHVVANATSVKVTFQNGKSVAAPRCSAPTRRPTSA